MTLLLDYLGIAVTLNCMSRCVHCFAGAYPARRDFITLESLKGWMEGLPPVKNITLFGGEPFIYHEEMIDISKYLLQDHKTPHLDLITNCFWAGNEEKAKKKLLPLRELGLHSIGFSADAFHEEFIPLKKVLIALRTARELGFPSYGAILTYMGNWEEEGEGMKGEEKKGAVDLNSIEGGISETDGTPSQPISFRKALQYHKRNEEIRKILIEEGFRVTLEEILPYGRARKRLRPYLRFLKPQNYICREGMSSSLLNPPRNLTLLPGGDLEACTGMILGNLGEKTIVEFYEDYKPENHPVISILSTKGSASLLSLLSPKDPAERRTPSFADGCDLCQWVRENPKRD